MASPPAPVAHVAPVPVKALIVAFPVEGCSAEGCLVLLFPNWAGFPPLLTGWVGTPSVPGRSASTGFPA